MLPVCGIHPGYVSTGVVYYINSWQNKHYSLHVMLDDNVIIILEGPVSARAFVWM